MKQNEKIYNVTLILEYSDFEQIEGNQVDQYY